MNEEQSKRLSDAANAVITAADALQDARDSLGDKRFGSEQERERLQAAQQTANRIDQAGKRVDEALRKAAVAALALLREGAYEHYLEAAAVAREARAMARSAPDQDGTAAKRERAEQALASLEAVLRTAAGFAFGK